MKDSAEGVLFVIGLLGGIAVGIFIFGLIIANGKSTCQEKHNIYRCTWDLTYTPVNPKK